jgi:Zn-dependent protease with chaperone function
VSSGEDTDLALDQGKPRCIPLKSLSFIFETLFIVLFDSALNLQDFYGTIVALGFFFSIILVYPCYSSYVSLEFARRRYKCR